MCFVFLSNKIDWVRLVRLSSVIELIKKSQFDYVRLPNQSNVNPTDRVRLSSIDFWFGFVRLTTRRVCWIGATSDLHQSIRRSNLELCMRFKRNRKSYHKDKVNYFININNFPLFSTSVDVPSSIVYVYRQGDKGLYSYLAIFGGNSNSVPESRNSENSIIDRKKLAPKQ